jgi:hypothetical protein
MDTLSIVCGLIVGLLLSLLPPIKKTQLKIYNVLKKAAITATNKLI